MLLIQEFCFESTGMKGKKEVRSEEDIVRIMSVTQMMEFIKNSVKIGPNSNFRSRLGEKHQLKDKCL